MIILAATDFSPCSSTATRLAVALARRHGASLILLNTIELVPIDPVAAPMSGAWEAEMAKAAREALESQADELRKSGLTVEVQVEFGTPAHHILEAARAAKAELVVVGTHGRRGAARLFLGSCAEEVVRSSACPVLVTGAEAVSLERWSGTAPLSVAVVTDGSRACEAAFAWVRTSGDTTPNDVSLIRVYWPPQEAARYGLDEPWTERGDHPELLRLLERDLRRDTRSLTGTREPPVRFRAAWHDAGDAIAEDVRQLGADAVVVGVPARRRGTLTGLSAASVLRASPVPVFCVPEKSQPKGRHIPKIRSVLIACDLSDPSRAAILPAYGLLLGGGRAELCYVHARGSGSALGDLPAIPDLTDGERAAIESRLRAAAPPEAAEHGIATHVSVVEGNLPAETLLQAAERLDVDAIALGSHGRSGLPRGVLGSVAEEVARRSSRPVLIVRGFSR